MMDGVSVHGGTGVDSTVVSGVAARSRTRFWGWPGWGHLRYTGLLSLVNALWFGLVYGGCDALIANRSFRVPINFDAELHMPFVPGMVVFYMSIYLLFLMGPFILRTRHEMRALIVSMAGITLIGGICFLIVPAELAFAPPGERDLGRWASLFSFADMLNLTYNLLPSLHVALSVVCVAAFASRARLTGKIVLWCWATGVAASTLLTHQHHILDVIGGVVLAIAIYLGVYVKKVHAMPYPAC